MKLASRGRPGLSRGVFPVLSFFLVFFAAAAQAGDRESVMHLRVAGLEAEGRCEQAIELARQAQADGIQDARIGLVAGRCEVRRQHYPEALAILDEAKELPPQLAEIDLYRGIALYHLDDLEAARQALDAAAEEIPDNALVDLYTGLLKLQADEPREAALLLERARRADANAVEPVASYYAFLAWRSLDEDERAEAALERVRQIDPEGPWVAEAERILTRRHLRSRPAIWAALQLGMEYDSNVVVRGNGVPLPEDISDDDDWRGVWSLDGGIELLRTEAWTAGFLAAYTGSAHTELADFNYHYPIASAWIDREFGDETTARFRYDFGYAWVDEEDFLQDHNWIASLHHRWEEANRTKLALRTYRYSYKFEYDPRLDLDRVDRDGVGVDLELEHRYDTGLGDLEVRGGYQYTHFSAKGSDYDHDGHEFMLGLHTSVPSEAESRARLVLDAWGSFTYQPYERDSFFDPGPRREDHIWQVGAALEHPVTERVSLLFQYSFVSNGSNVQDYDYDRHIVGGYLRVNLW